MSASRKKLKINHKSQANKERDRARPELSPGDKTNATRPLPLPLPPSCPTPSSLSSPSLVLLPRSRPPPSLFPNSPTPCQQLAAAWDAAPPGSRCGRGASASPGRGPSRGSGWRRLGHGGGESDGPLRCLAGSAGQGRQRRSATSKVRQGRQCHGTCNTKERRRHAVKRALLDANLLQGSGLDYHLPPSAISVQPRTTSSATEIMQAALCGQGIRCTEQLSFRHPSPPTQRPHMPTTIQLSFFVFF